MRFIDFKSLLPTFFSRGQKNLVDNMFGKRCSHAIIFIFYVHILYVTVKIHPFIGIKSMEDSYVV